MNTNKIDVHGLVAKSLAARDMLRESAKQHRLAGDEGHGRHCDAVADELEAALRQSGEADQFVRNQPCGCVMCVCADESRCHGCGAKHCGNRTDHQPYVKTAPPATPGLVEALREAQRSLETIATKAEIDPYMQSFLQVRGYANSRSEAALAALAAHDARGDA